MMKIAIEKGRKVKKDLKMGICGEHGGDPRFCGVLPQDRLKLRKLLALQGPIARLAGAQATLKEKMGGKDLSKSTV